MGNGDPNPNNLEQTMKVGEEEEDKQQLGSENMEAEEEEEDDEEDDDYAFKFDDDTNALEFVQNENFGDQIYQQFQRFEYESLAEKKRKAMMGSQPQSSKKQRLPDEGFSGMTMEDFMEVINYTTGRKRKKKKQKKRGRPAGSKKKLSPEITRMLGDSTLHYAHGRYNDAISLLHEVIRLDPYIPDSYYTLGNVYKALGDDKKAWNFYLLAARISPRDSSLWEKLYKWAVEMGKDDGVWLFCLLKAISANPKDEELRYDLAYYYIERKDYVRAAKAFEHIRQIRPDNVDALKTEAKLYLQSGQAERCIGVLEDYIKASSENVDLSVLYMLIGILMEHDGKVKALQHIERAQVVYFKGRELPLNLIVKAGICNLHIGNLEKAVSCFNTLLERNVSDHVSFFMEVADSCMDFKQFNLALKYYMMLDGNFKGNSGFLYIKIARCYLSLKQREPAIQFFYKALNSLEGHIDARVTLASLLIEEGKEDEAITLLSPPENAKPSDSNSSEPRPWWLDAKIKLKLCDIYRTKMMPEEFIDTILSTVRESLFIETTQQKVKARKRLSTKVLIERAKLLDDEPKDDIFGGFRPLASSLERLRASRAKKMLEKRAMAGNDDHHSSQSDNDDPPPPVALREPPLPNFLKEKDHHNLVIDLCKALASLRRYWEALEIINLTLRLGSRLPNETREELRSLGAQMAYYTTNPKHGFDCARYIVQKHPRSIAAWNCYYKVVSNLESRDAHLKFIRDMREKHRESIPPYLIYGHQFTSISWHQVAAKSYLEAYKLMPESPLVNMCVGTALINLALGHRLQNKENLCVAQGLAFLFNYLKLCENSQEALYNVARACHHVGLVTLAASYYEKVLAIQVKDYPIPRLPNENADENQESGKPGYCDLRREAAYNLHLIYKRSGAFDLARQILRDHCSV